MRPKWENRLSLPTHESQPGLINQNPSPFDAVVTRIVYSSYFTKFDPQTLRAKSFPVIRNILLSQNQVKVLLNSKKNSLPHSTGQSGT